MNKQIKAALQLILGGILLVTFTIAGCNNSKTEKVVTKDTVPIIDTMEHNIGDSAPIIDGKPM